MKRQSIYIDPEILKQKNGTEDQSVQQAPSQMETKKTIREQSDQPAPAHLLEQEAQSPTEPKKEVFGTRRQMQNDLKYTSAMKKQKDINADEAQQKVASISSRSNNVLMKIKTVFPFDFFPNTVVIDANKVTIIDAVFFASETVTSILLEEITDVVVESNFFLAKLLITYSHHPMKPEYYAVSFLKKREALRAKGIIQGLLVLRISEGIDLSKLQPDEIVKHLENIGKSHENMPAAL